MYHSPQNPSLRPPPRGVISPPPLSASQAAESSSQVAGGVSASRPAARTWPCCRPTAAARCTSRPVLLALVDAERRGPTPARTLVAEAARSAAPGSRARRSPCGRCRSTGTGGPARRWLRRPSGTRRSRRSCPGAWARWCCPTAPGRAGDALVHPLLEAGRLLLAPPPHRDLATARRRRRRRAARRGAGVGCGRRRGLSPPSSPPPQAASTGASPAAASPPPASFSKRRRERSRFR